jgi:diaminopropionate ammonia-lyase
MGGMSCGDVSSIAWEILKNSANYCLTIPDKAISTTVALLAEARLSEEKIVGGECAVPGVIALIGSFNNKEYLDKLKLNAKSNVLLFGCEGLTDKAMYQKLLSDGLQKI